MDMVYKRGFGVQRSSPLLSLSLTGLQIADLLGCRGGCSRGHQYRGLLLGEKMRGCKSITSPVMRQAKQGATSATAFLP